MAQTYTYSISGDITAGVCNPNALMVEIASSAIVGTCEGIGCIDNVLEITFTDALTSGDELILDDLVLNHSGDEIPEGTLPPEYDSNEMISIYDASGRQQFSGTVVKYYDTLVHNSNEVLFSWSGGALATPIEETSGDELFQALTLTRNSHIIINQPGLYQITFDTTVELVSGYYKGAYAVLEKAESSNGSIWTMWEEVAGSTQHMTAYTIYAPLWTMSTTIPLNCTANYTKIQIKETMNDHYPAYAGTVKNPANGSRLSVMRIK